MLDQLINLGKESLASSLQTNEALNTHQVEGTFNVAKDSFFNGLKEQALSGNISQLTNLFNGQEGNSSFLQDSVMNHFVPQLASKLGIPEDKASSIGNAVIPVLINKFASKETGSVDDSGGLLSMFGIDSGDVLGDIGKKLGGLFS